MIKDYAKLIIMIIYSLMGKDTYKYLKSYNNLIQDLVMVANTMSYIIETKNDDTEIIKHHTHNEYKFFKSHLYDVLSSKYVILNDGFRKQAIHDESSRIVDFNIDMSYVIQLVNDRFNINTIDKDMWKDIEDLCLDARLKNSGFIMTPQQWNNFWEEIIRASRSDKTLENLECRALNLSQIPGVLLKYSRLIDESRINSTIDVVELNIDESMNPEVPKYENVYYLHDFKNETEYPLEFAIVMGCSRKRGPLVALLSPSKYECEVLEARNLFDVHSYLLGDF